jgi:hypothetical protein
MASTAEILAKEALSEPRIYLYREGIFWKAYQRSAYRVLQRRPDFKLKKKYIKAVSCEVVSLGFPIDTLYRIFDKQEIEEIDEKVVAISGNDTGMQAYQEWFAAVPLSDQVGIAAPLPSVPALSGSPEIVLRKIREFPIEQSTPLECMMFLARMRKELTEYGHI